MSEVLLIDAEQPFAGEIKSALEGRGFSVTQLDDGKEGLEYARGNKPDLIVLCVELPKMSGYSICNKLKKDGDLKKIPLIITSSEATPETFAQHKKLKTRAEDYLIKPFDLDALIEKIGSHVEVPAGGGAPPPAPMTDGGGDFENFDNFESLEELDAGEIQLDEGGALDDLKIESAEASAPEGHPDEESLDLGGDDLLGGLGGSDDDLLGGLGGSSDDDLLAGLDTGGLEGGLDDGSDGAGLDLGSEAGGGLDAFDAGMTDDLGAGLGDFGGGDLGGDGGPDSGLDGGLDSGLNLGASNNELPDFDSAFEQISPDEESLPDAEPAPPAAAAPPRPAPMATPTPGGGSSAADLAAMNALRRENTDLKATVSELEAKLKAAEDAARSARDELDSAKGSSSSSARETLELKKEIRNKEKELMELKDQIFQKEEQVVEVQEELERVKAASDEAVTGAAAKDAEIAKLSAKVQALTEERDALEAQVRDRVAAVEDENADLRNQLSGAQAELASLRTDHEQRISSLEAENKETGEQLVEAYNRIKSEEKAREKAKDALNIAMALLSGDVDDDTGSSLERQLDA